MSSRGEARDGVENAADAVQHATSTASRSRQGEWVARGGMAARGIVYVLLGMLAVLVSSGSERQSVDQQGAFTELATRPGGSILLAVLAVGLAAYALWQLSRAIAGPGGDEQKTVSRLVAAGVTFIYASLAVSAVTVLLGARQSKSSENEVLTARVMSYPGGTLLVALVGVGIIIVGGVMLYKGATTDFMKYFRSLSRWKHIVIKQLGRVGAIGRGLVFALVGVLVVSAAVTFDPGKAGGVDDAFRTALDQPYGRPLALAAAAAFIAFGLYGLAEARYRDVET